MRLQEVKTGGEKSSEISRISDLEQFFGQRALPFQLREVVGSRRHPPFTTLAQLISPFPTMGIIV